MEPKTQRHDFIVSVTTLNSYANYVAMKSLKMFSLLMLRVKSKEKVKLPGSPKFNQCG